ACAIHRLLPAIAIGPGQGQPGRKVTEVWRGKRQFVDGIVEVERNPLLVVGDLVHDQVRHLPYGIATLQPDAAVTAVASSEERCPDDLTRFDAKGIQQSMNEVDVVDQA